MKTIEMQRLLIDRFITVDTRDALELFGDGDSMRMTGLWPPLDSIAGSLARVLEWSNDGAHRAILKKDTGEFIGYIAVNPDSEDGRDDTRELAFALVKRHRGKGYMKEAVTAVLDELRDNGVRYVWACCIRGNDASEKLIRSLGFVLQQEGTFDSKNDRTYERLEFRITL